MFGPFAHTSNQQHGRYHRPGVHALAICMWCRHACSDHSRTGRTDVIIVHCCQTVHRFEQEKDLKDVFCRHKSVSNAVSAGKILGSSQKHEMSKVAVLSPGDVCCQPLTSKKPRAFLQPGLALR